MKGNDKDWEMAVLGAFCRASLVIVGIAGVALLIRILDTLL